MAQTTTLSSSAPPTPSDPSNAFLSRATSDSASRLPKGQGKSTTERLEPLQRSFSDPLPSNPSRRFGSAHESSKNATNAAVEHKSRLKHPGISAASYGGEGEGDRITKTHSHPSHKNIYTECGRHSDDWLFGGFSVTEALKRMFEKK